MADLILHDTLSEIPPPTGTPGRPEQATGRPLDPFTTHRFLSALEAPAHRQGHRLAGAAAGPARGRPAGCRDLPLYVKTHSQGEYIFDHGWAEAYERAGGRYYPKLQSRCPSPRPPAGASWGRPSTAPPWLAAIRDWPAATGCPRCTSPSARQKRPRRWPGPRRDAAPRHPAVPLGKPGLRQLRRLPAELSSRKRKMIRKERETARASGLTIRALTGDQIEPQHWDAFWAFYQDTGSRKWGRPYLTRAAFDACTHDARRHAAGPGLRRRPARWRAPELHRPRHALRPLLGLRRGPTIPACISNCATIRPSTGPSPTGCSGSRPGRRANTSWPAATCRWRRIRCTGSPTLFPRAPWRATWNRNAARWAKRSRC
jgi:hypothetical protein